MDVLRTEEDLYDLGMGYFRKAGEMNVRYCEVLFDNQAHTRRGVDCSDCYEWVEESTA
jgi:adenosine deaminase